MGEALRRAGPRVIEGWTGRELGSQVLQSPESFRRKTLIAWFRRELFAGSFDCSYRSASGYFTKIPPEVFYSDESEQLFADDTAPDESSSIETGGIRQNDLDWRGRNSVTWVDCLPGTPYWLSTQIESAAGRELFISLIGFEAALKQFNEAGVKKFIVIVPPPANRPPEMRDEVRRILRKLGPEWLTGKKAALLVKVNAQTKSPVSRDTLRRALKDFRAEG